MNHWKGLTRFLDDGRLEVDTNTVERAIRPIKITAKNALFAGSDSGGRHWSVVSSMIETCKLNGVEPLAWMTDVLTRVVTGQTKNNELASLLPWNWKAAKIAEASDTS
jgi:transposase